MTEVFKVCGYIPYGPTSATFALPIFQSKHRDGKFIQIPDTASIKICDFEQVDEPEQSTNFSRESSLFKAGMDLQYLLVVEGEIYFGTVSSLEDAFQALINRPGMPASVAMQIAELIGDAQGLKRSLSAYLSRLSEEKSVLDARFIENSVVRNHVWAKLVGHCNPRSHNELQHMLKRVLLNVLVIDGEIDLEASLKIHMAETLEINVEQFLWEVNQTFEGLGLMAEASGTKLGAVVDVGMVEEKLAEIRRMPRQETRLGRLMKALIEDEQLGKV